MYTRSWLAMVALTAGVATIVSADPRKSSPDSNQYRNSVSVADSLNVTIDQWYDAALHDQGRAHGFEKQLLKSLQKDIDNTQGRIRQLRDQISSSGGQISSTDSVPNPLSDSLTRLSEIVRTKRALVDAITRTDALSNKYRLLGDYVGLIRREVGLPKLKLAVDKKSEADKN